MPNRVVMAIGLLLLSFTAAATQAQAQATVSAMGEAVIRRPPDRVFISFSTSARGETPQEAQSRGAAAMKSVQDALEALKLPGGQVMSSGMNLHENWDTVDTRQVRRGYVELHSIVVALDDVSRAGEVMTVATGAGATSISGLRFDRRDREELEKQALRTAVGVARARAEVLAAGAGRTLDRIVRIAEERAAMAAGGLGSRMRDEVVDVVLAGNVGVPVAAGEIEIRMRVVLTATLK